LDNAQRVPAWKRGLKIAAEAATLAVKDFNAAREIVQKAVDVNFLINPLFLLGKIIRIMSLEAFSYIFAFSIHSTPMNI
jgi:hypothetical protein